MDGLSLRQLAVDDLTLDRDHVLRSTKRLKSARDCSPTSASENIAWSSVPSTGPEPRQGCTCPCREEDHTAAHRRHGHRCGGRGRAPRRRTAATTSRSSWLRGTATEVRVDTLGQEPFALLAAHRICSEVISLACVDSSNLRPPWSREAQPAGRPACARLRPIVPVHDGCPWGDQALHEEGQTLGPALPRRRAPGCARRLGADRAGSGSSGR